MRRGMLVLAAAAAGSVLASIALGPDRSRDGAATGTFHAEAALRAGTEVSTNWSGYVSTGLGSTASTASPNTTFKNATATFRQPAATCTASGRTAASAVWVGLGGYSETATALEQAGTSADCSPEGVASYYAWYELVPEPSITVKTLKIVPGDLITASVVVDGSGVLVQIKNRTRKTAFTKRVTLDDPDLTSAEWIVEAPAECSSADSCRQIPLANFGSVDFTRVAALASIDGEDRGGTIASELWQSTRVRLAPNTRRYFGDRRQRPVASPDSAGAKPVSLSDDGKGFTVKWVANPG